MSSWTNARMIAYGFLLGTAGVSILASRDAKQVYTHVTACLQAGRHFIDEDLHSMTSLLPKQKESMHADKTAIA